MIKLPLTDKFLWELYKLGESLRLPAIPRTTREALSLDYFKFRQAWRQKERQKYFSQLVYHLKKLGLIEIDNLKGKKAMLLTPKGSERILRIQNKVGERTRRKDGKWQMIIFDIPEKKRRLRDFLRKTLLFLGYKMLQKSIWVCPYETEKETEEFLRKHLLDRYVKLFLIEEIEI